jgi:hypothetical protein
MKLPYLGDWALVLFIVLFSSLISTLLFYTIRDIVKGVKYLDSQDKAGNCDDDNCNNQPEPKREVLIKVDTPINYKAQDKSTEHTASNLKIKALIIRHIKRIINRLKGGVNHKRGEPRRAVINQADMSVSLNQYDG